jgi:tRNA threonylcarbamoyladenosine biosynthesis protein TsaE
MNEKSFSLLTTDEEQTQALGERIGRICEKGMIVSLKGPVGAGKTVLARGIAAALGIREPVSSPSYALIHEYGNPGTLRLVHIDFYRIHDIEEFELLGGEELFYSDAVTVIEWSDIVEDLLPPQAIKVSITLAGDSRRLITVTGAGSEYPGI